MNKIVLLLLAISILSGCSNKQDASKINITVSTTMIADLMNQIGGERVEVYGMMKEGVDPHSYKARPSDVMAIDMADIVAYNGIYLEAKLVDIFDSLADQGKTLIKLEDGLDTSRFIEVNEGIYDPHIWFDVELWKQAAIYAADVLSNYEEESAELFQKNLKKYLLDLEQLDTYIKDSLEQIEPSKRILVSAHDAFMYFGSAYDVEVVAVQGINSQSEAGIRDINLLSERIIKEGIKSVYSESSVPIKTIEALVASVESRGYPLKIGGELYSDSLKEGSTYIETFKENVDTILEGMK